MKKGSSDPPRDLKDQPKTSKIRKLPEKAKQILNMLRAARLKTYFFRGGGIWLYGESKHFKAISFLSLKKHVNK